MGINKKILIMFFLIIVFILMFNMNSYASSEFNTLNNNFIASVNLNSLNYDVNLNSDGSMDIVETWNINISNMNTLVKRFNENSQIVNTKVSLVENEVEKTLTQIYEAQSELDAECFYALPTSDEKFEIVWNVGLEMSSDTRTYKIYYTIPNAVVVYEDCSDFYWKVFEGNNLISGENITGTIHLQNKIKDIGSLKIWGRSNLGGGYEILSADKIKFSMSELTRDAILEIRIVTDENICPDCENIINLPKLQEILEKEEGISEPEENEIIDIKIDKSTILIINIIIAIVLFLIIKKYIKAGKELNFVPEYKLKYFKEIPNESEATPARALYTFDDFSFSDFDYNLPDIFSAKEIYGARINLNVI